MQRVIGIDFGTSTTYMNVKRYNGSQPLEDTFSYLPVLFEYGGSSGFVATIVRENADGSFDFGEKASEPLTGSTVHREFKMRLESPDAEEREEARRLTREFFRFLYAAYARQAASLGSPDDEVETMVSYPVKWQPETVRFMLSAAREAGFEHVIGLDEATAAVSAVLCHDPQAARLLAWDRPGYLLLIDMGAGTTDLVVCRYEISGGGIQVRRVLAWPQGEGEPAFGGREIDRALALRLEDYLRQALPATMAPMAGDIVRTPGEVKRWKENNVSPILAEKGRVTGCGFLQTYKSVLTQPFPAFDRAAFESWPGIHQGLQDDLDIIKDIIGGPVGDILKVDLVGVISIPHVVHLLDLLVSHVLSDLLELSVNLHPMLVRSPTLGHLCDRPYGSDLGIQVCPYADGEHLRVFRAGIISGRTYRRDAYVGCQILQVYLDPLVAELLNELSWNRILVPDKDISVGVILEFCD